MRRFRQVGLAGAAAAMIAVGVAQPAAADGGDTNGYWQYHASYATLEECDNAGRPYVPSVADGWGCVQYIITNYQYGPRTTDWNLHLVFAS